MVTIKDVAERAGVPVRMAARALSGTTLGKRRDARERAERIRQAAKELGYCPSEIAVSLTRGRTRTLGLLLPSLTDMFYAAASEIAMDEAAREGYSILIRLTRFRPELAAEIEKELPEFPYRLKVKAGLTGYAQIYGKYNTTAYDKLKLDLTYIRNYSFFLDLKLMIMTPKIMLMKESTEGVIDEDPRLQQQQEAAAARMDIKVKDKNRNVI